MEKENLTIAFILCLAFSLLIAALPNDFHGKGYDYYFHYGKAKGHEQYEDMQGNTFSTMNYPPLFHWLASIFSFREETFYLFALFFLGIAIPITLVFITGHWISALLYFSATSFFYHFETGLYPQALAVFLALLVLHFKDWRIRIALVALGILAHSTGFYLVALFALACYLKESGLLEKAISKLKVFPVACSGWFPRNRPNELLETEIIEGSSRGTSNALNLGRLTKFCVEIFPLPFAIMALFGFFIEKDWHLLLIFFVGLMFGIFEYRIFFVSAIVGIIGLTTFFKRVVSNWSFKWQLPFFALVFAYAFIQFHVWWQLKFYCYPLWIVKPV